MTRTRKRGRKGATPTPTHTEAPLRLAVPVEGAALAWLASRLHQSSRGWHRAAQGGGAPVTLTVSRDRVSAVLWEPEAATLGIVAHIPTMELVDAVDDLPSAGFVATVDLRALVGLSRALKRSRDVTVELRGEDETRLAVTLRTEAGAYRAPRAHATHQWLPFGAPGALGRLDGRSLARALDLGARLADPAHVVGDFVTLRMGADHLRVDAGGATRFARLTAGAVDVTEPVECAVASSAARAMDGVLRQSIGEATVHVSHGLVTCTGRTRHGELGIVAKRHDVPETSTAAGALFDAVDERPSRLVCQVEAADLLLALKRGRALAPLASSAAPLTVVLTTDAGGRLAVGHVLGSRREGDAGVLHRETLDGWATGRGAIALDPALLGGLLPKRGPVVLDCGEPDAPVRVRAVEGALSVDTLVMPFGPSHVPSWVARLAGRPETFLDDAAKAA